METEAAKRRVDTIAAHFSVTDNISGTSISTHLFPLNCSGGLTSIKKRCDNSMHFARQDSKSQGSFMKQASTEQGCLSESKESSETVPPLFSQPAITLSNVPKIRHLQHAISDYMLPYLQPPKFSRANIERDVPLKFSPKNNTKHLGDEKKRSPRMDVAESRGKYILFIELPGIRIDDIRVEVDNTNLTVQTIKGRIATNSLRDRLSSSCYKSEILEGPFHIMWPLPFDVNPDSVSAEFVDGLLRITISKLRVPVW